LFQMSKLESATVCNKEHFSSWIAEFPHNG
jgi:hypothetical protein